MIRFMFVGTPWLAIMDLLKLINRFMVVINGAVSVYSSSSGRFSGNYLPRWPTVFRIS
jgi:hypothetical protein